MSIDHTFIEKYGSSGKSMSYIFGENEIQSKSFKKRTFYSIQLFFQTVFLPQGYPESVSGDYLEYQIWDTIQAFCSSITGSLATQAVLKGVGVGDESATVAAATITWLLKDGTGMIGRIMFAWFQGTFLDCDCKRWRFFADILNDVAIFLDIIAPNFIHLFTFIICISGVLRSIVGVAGGSTRSAIMEHQARRNNIADVSAKDGSQETLVNLAGLLCSLLLIPSVSNNFSLLWFLFLLFTFFHLYANYQAVRCITMETFNQSRLSYVVSMYLQKKNVPSVAEANNQESILFGPKKYFQIMLGCSIEKVLDKKLASSNINTIFRNFMKFNYSYICHVNFYKGKICLLLSSKSSRLDLLKASYHAHVIQFCYAHSFNKDGHKLVADELKVIISACRAKNMDNLLKKSHEFVENSFPEFISDVKKNGWVTKPVLLGADEWRFQ